MQKRLQNVKRRRHTSLSSKKRKNIDKLRHY